MDSLFIIINYIENPNKMKDLKYLVKQHKEVVIASELSLRDRGHLKDASAFQPWLIIKNNGEGIFLVKKIIEKFQPWVSMKLQEPIYKHDIPGVFWEMEKWSRENEKKFGKIRIRRKSD